MRRKKWVTSAIYALVIGAIIGGFATLAAVLAIPAGFLAPLLIFTLGLIGAVTGLYAAVYWKHNQEGRSAIFERYQRIRLERLHAEGRSPASPPISVEPRRPKPTPGGKYLPWPCRRMYVRNQVARKRFFVDDPIEDIEPYLERSPKNVRRADPPGWDPFVNNRKSKRRDFSTAGTAGANAMQLPWTE